MDSCLRSNLLTAVGILLIAHGMSGMGISQLYDMNDTLQARVDKLLSEAIQDNKQATLAQQAAAEAHRAAVDELNEKKRQLEAKGCKL